MDATPSPVQIQAQWLLDPGAIPQPANQVLIQVGAPVGELPDTAYINFGHLNPPLVSGPPGQPLTQEMVDGQIYPVIPVARIVMSVEKLIEMRDTISKIVAPYEKDTR